MEPLTLRVRRAVDDQPTPGTALAVPTGGGILGRAESADVVIPSVTVSRTHARLTPGADGWRVEALTSANGTFVDGAALAPGVFVLLGAGAQLQLGGVVLEAVLGERTHPVFEPLHSQVRLAPSAGSPIAEPVLVARFDASASSVRCGGRLLTLEPQPARALATLIEHAGAPVHRWDLQDRLGAGANLDRCMSKVRRALREALDAGVLARERVEAGIRTTLGEPVELADLDPDALLRRFVASRRGHGYVLCLDPAEVRVEEE